MKKVKKTIITSEDFNELYYAAIQLTESIAKSNIHPSKFSGKEVYHLGIIQGSILLIDMKKDLHAQLKQVNPKEFDYIKHIILESGKTISKICFQHNIGTQDKNLILNILALISLPKDITFKEDIVIFDEEKEPPLNRITEILGGYFTLINLPNDDQMLVNEEGLLRQMDINPTASKLANQDIYGPAIVLKNSSRMVAQ